VDGGDTKDVSARSNVAAVPTLTGTPDKAQLLDELGL
jgi:hypothetical protein